MADKKSNEILEEQRRAREEFLRLKKMQHGEIKADPKPSEVAIVPKTFKEKCANFWYQYKWHTIGITATVIVLAVLVAQCMSVPKYDFSIIYFTYEPIIDQQVEPISEYFSKYGKDLNGDGEVNVQVMNCSISNEQSNVQYRNAQLQKLQAYIAAEYKAMLYITDEESMKYFDNISGDTSIFESEPLKLSEDFYKATATKDFGELPEGLQLSCRKTSGTTLNNNKKAKPIAEEAKRIFELLSEKNK